MAVARHCSQPPDSFAHMAAAGSCLHVGCGSNTARVLLKRQVSDSCDWAGLYCHMKALLRIPLGRFYGGTGSGFFVATNPRVSFLRVSEF